MKQITYLIPGIPVPLRRPVFGKGHCWDEQKELKNRAGIYLKNSQEPYQPKSEALKEDPAPVFSGPISVDVTFYFPHTIHKKNKLKRWHIIRPDLDNCVKFILDVATGITYNDDCIVSDIHARKMYSDSPRTEFTISELKEN